MPTSDTQQTDVSIRECPFCGGFAEVYKSDQGFVIRCAANNACDVYVSVGPASMLAEAAAVWNCRGGTNDGNA